MEKKKKVVVLTLLAFILILITTAVWMHQRKEREKVTRAEIYREFMLFGNNRSNNEKSRLHHIGLWSERGAGYVLYKLGIALETNYIHEIKTRGVIGTFSLTELIQFLELEDATEEEIINAIEDELAQTVDDWSGHNNARLDWNGNEVVIHSDEDAAVAYMIYGKNRILNDETIAFVDESGNSIREKIAYDSILDIAAVDFVNAVVRIDEALEYKERPEERFGPTEATYTNMNKQWTIYLVNYEYSDNS